MRQPSRRGARIAVVAAAAALAVAAGAASGTASAPVVHLRGTAYEFNNVGVRLAGAAIRITESRASRRGSGRTPLRPRRPRPCPGHAVHHRRGPPHHLPADVPHGRSRPGQRQLPTRAEDVYRALVALLAVPVDAAGDPAQCAIVSTLSTRDVRDLDFAGFIAHGAHGVAGATATTTPALPPPTYFNAQVIPDPAQVGSSADGGVVWTGVPTGVYTVRAHHPTSRFASFVATCRPGRVINANPPWGLHQLGLANPARVAVTWTGNGSPAVLRRLLVDRLPPGATIRVRCDGPRCVLRTVTIRPAVGVAHVDVGAALGAAARRLRAGQTLQVTVAAHAYDTTLVRWRIAAGAMPTAVRRCVPLGDTQPRPRC